MSDDLTKFSKDVANAFDLIGGAQSLEAFVALITLSERQRIRDYLLKEQIIRESMLGPNYLVAYSENGPIDILHDLGASEKP